ncbi:MAG: flavin reductase family protein [Pseudomonadota bacterium]
MFYDPIANTHGLRHDPFKALAVPRPIGWVSSLSSAGDVNLAPYSFFNAISDRPQYVVFGSAGRKDSVQNISETGEFVCSMATEALAAAQNATSAHVPRDVDEFDISGLHKAPSEKVAPPRVREAPVAFECKLWKMFDLPPVEAGGAPGYTIVFGFVVGTYIDDAFINDDIVDTAAMRPLARLGYLDYAVVNAANTMTLKRPG